MKTCQTCSKQFEITEEDRAFYQKVSPVFNGQKYLVPEPDNCPDCRAQHRLTFRNFFNLYHRKCDLTGKQILSMYHENSRCPVYETPEWWSDKWDPLDYGLDIDFETPVFEKIKKLHETVPRMSIFITRCENTDYCNASLLSKNCYLIFGNISNEDCSYGHIVWQSSNCYDCLYTYRSELCYECIDCFGCYNTIYSQDCNNCTDCSFTINCRNCSNCFGCTDLHNAEYCIFNQRYSKEEYFEKLKEFDIGNHSLVKEIQQKVRELSKQDQVKFFHGLGCEDVTGDYLYNSKNIENCYDLKNCQDCKHSATLESFIDCHDCNYCPMKTELSYQNVSVYGYNILFSHNVLNDSSFMLYSDHCFSCSNCFGCAGLKNKKYCIFNKQYTEEEYNKLVPQIINYMKQTGEWGQYFPFELSMFGYNETMAQEYYPLSKKQALSKGLSWKEDDQNASYNGPVVTIPDHINDINENFIKNILTCEVTAKNYKIIPQELEFLKKKGLPLPRRCFTQRHKDRMSLRNPRKLFDRNCMQCNKEIQTTYSPEREERVLCEECYLAVS